MTPFNRYLWAAIGPRLRTAGNALLLDVAIVLVLTLSATFGWIATDLDATTFMGFVVSVGVAVMIGLFVRLATRTERTWGSNLDRLVPLGDTARYLAQQLATALTFCGFCAVQLAAWAAGGRWWLGSDNTTVDPRLAAFFIAILVLVVIWGFTLISVVHLVTLTITAFTPVGHQKLFTRLLYVVVTIGIITLLNGLSTIGEMVFSHGWPHFLQAGISVDGNHLGTQPLALLVAVGLMLLLIGAASALNAYLLSHWTETQTQLY